MRYLGFIYLCLFWLAFLRLDGWAQSRDSLKKLADSARLADVVIHASKKSKIEQDATKLSFTPNAALKAGNSVIDLLKSTPLISYNEVGAEGTPEVSIIGKNSTKIFINGKPTFMPLEAIISLLSAQNAQDVERIEVITNPNPNPSIQQGGGIINIVLKDHLQKGWSGGIRMKLTQNHRTGGSMGGMLAYQHPKFNASLGFFGGSRARIANNISQNEFERTHILQKSESLIGSRSLASGMRGTLTYKPNKQHNLTLGLGAFVLRRERQEDNTNSFYAQNSAQSYSQQAYGSYKVNNIRLRRLLATQANLDYEYKPDNRGSALQIKAMMSYTSALPNTFLNTFRAQDTSRVAQENSVHSLNYRLVASYNHVFSKLHSLEAGVSFMQTMTDNKFAVKHQILGQWQYIPNRNLQYSYTTPTYMAYVSHAANWNKYWQTVLNLSLQYYSQQGITKHNQEVSAPFNKNYLFFLPNLAISYQLNPNHLFALSFIRISQPPSFMDVNPFVIQQGNNNYTQGNAELLVPSNYESSLSYTLKQAYTFSLRYSYTRGAYTKVQTLGKEKNSILTMPFNYGTLHGAYAVFTISQRFFQSYWQLQGNLALQYTYYNGKIPLFRLQKGGFGGEISATNTISLTNPSKNTNAWLANIEFRYNLPSFLLYGLSSIGPNLTLGVKKKYKNWTFALNVNDVLHSAYYVNLTSMPSLLKTEARVYKDTRSATLSVNFSFGGKAGMGQMGGYKKRGSLKVDNQQKIEQSQREQPSVNEDNSGDMEMR